VSRERTNIAVRCDGQVAGRDTARATAEQFAEEFARVGYSAPQILGLFNNPFFSGAHAALLALGEDAIRTIVVKAVVRWPAVRIVDATPRSA
jgi:hypothetical protein